MIITNIISTEEQSRDFLKEKEISKAMTIIEIASKHFGIPVELITMPDSSKTIVKGSRIKALSDARHSSMRLIKDHTKLSLKAIGKILGNRDHSTVIHGLEKIEDRLFADKEFSKSFKIFQYKVNANFNPAYCFAKRFEIEGYVFT